MPTPVEFVGGQVKADYNVSISWDFKAKLSDLPPEGFEVEPEELGSVPLHGVWSLRINTIGDRVDLLIRHGGLAYAALGDRVTVTFQLAYFADGTLRQIAAGSWSARVPHPSRDDVTGMTHTAYQSSLAKDKLAKEGRLPVTVQSSIQNYRLLLKLTQEEDAESPPLCRTPMPDVTKALQLANLSHSPYMDVCLLFKQADGRKLELWMTADFLGKASDYYKALFASGAAETPPVRTAGPDPSVDWQDSDDETDAFLVERDWMSCTTSKPDMADLDYQQIEVRETAYSTMCAILLYLQTGHIKFAPIRSSHALPPDELATKREVALVDALEEQPTLPLPVLPKSVYRLAHLLEPDELQKLALNSLASSLTISGAADKLLHPVSLAYDKLRKVVIDFVVKNWKEVKVTESWRAARAKVTSEPTEGGAQILFDLLAAIDDT